MRYSMLILGLHALLLAPQETGGALAITAASTSSSHLHPRVGISLPPSHRRRLHHDIFGSAFHVPRGGSAASTGASSSTAAAATTKEEYLLFQEEVLWVVFSKSPPKPPEVEDAAARSERPRTATSGPARRTRDMIATIAVADGYAAGPNPRGDVMPGTRENLTFLLPIPILWSIARIARAVWRSRWRPPQYDRALAWPGRPCRRSCPSAPMPWRAPPASAPLSPPARSSSARRDL